MTYQANVRWLEKMRFEAVADSQKPVVLDAAPEFGGENQGARPMELLLMALGGCTMMDVVSILQKMRQEFQEAFVEIRAERASEHPKIFTEIHLTYVLVGTHLDAAKVEQAVKLSREKYCSVSHIVEKTAKITESIEIRPSA